ncbi:MAG: sucrase ferredoxin [Cyanomargarita calcarea GSE-NOS-MK-12-04C]|jgi:hypothetical protein|uniref:Sucrase ferredoxin n=1 Tax=Cyanomargarita calcarea GSE-NOS-MK-12-04C TaxID=2839659 RepID=A0A951QLX5_9CYAN|nr:sucrase ferredoxin [Cyanomargarita calcarea GSE-NOS-MK-12-04C]
MDNLFCSDNSRKVREDMIGSASNHQIYILVECPPPWASDAFNSRWVPNSLSLLVEELKRLKLPIKFLLIANNYSHKIDHTTLLIYQKKEGLSNGYSKQEFRLANIEQVAPTVRKWLLYRHSSCEIDTAATRDILVCTHGSHDQCCARYGNPFYYHASETISDFKKQQNVRIWKSSHFGGHRFAPTIVDLPEGRYYGGVDQESFQSILTRTGDIEFLNQVYRGWGIIPTSIQVLERELILRHGWDWFNYKVAGEIIQESLDKNIIQAELTVEKPHDSLCTYQATLVKDESKSLEIKPSCNAKEKSKFVKYTVANFWLSAKKLLTYSA